MLQFSTSSVLDFMKEVIPWLEHAPFVAGYAWFNFLPIFAQGTSSALYDDAQLITTCGRYYASVTPENPMGDQSITITV
jgi:Glycosyl hydrolase catalytic core